jgi:hypothetical protein
MSSKNFIFIFLIFSPIVALCQTHKSNTVKVILETRQSMSVEMPEVPEPPAHINSKFKTLQEWLNNICDSNQPQKPVSEFKFNFIQSSDKYIVYMVGINKYGKDENSISTYIEFQPNDMYFILPKPEYDNLTNDQVREKLSSQLKKFVATEKFANSFLAKSKVIKLWFNNETIWQK